MCMNDNRNIDSCRYIKTIGRNECRGDRNKKTFFDLCFIAALYPPKTLCAEKKIAQSPTLGGLNRFENRRKLSNMRSLILNKTLSMQTWIDQTVTADSRKNLSKRTHTHEFPENCNAIDIHARSAENFFLCTQKPNSIEPGTELSKSNWKTDRIHHWKMEFV